MEKDVIIPEMVEVDAKEDESKNSGDDDIEEEDDEVNSGPRTREKMDRVRMF
jgi:hypothetical protein